MEDKELDKIRKRLFKCIMLDVNGFAKKLNKDQANAILIGLYERGRYDLREEIDRDYFLNENRREG